MRREPTRSWKSIKRHFKYSGHAACATARREMLIQGHLVPEMAGLSNLRSLQRAEVPKHEPKRPGFFKRILSSLSRRRGA